MDFNPFFAREAFQEAGFLERHLSSDVCESSGNPSEQSRSAVPRDQNQCGHEYAAAISIREADAFNNHVDLKTRQ